MKTFKRILSFVLVLVLTVGLMPTGASAAGANDRIKTFLKMAAGAEITNEDVEGMSMDQLVFLGVYLSNFYQPFGTEFGGEGSDDQIAQNCKDDMIKALQTKLAFSDEMAETLVRSVLQMTRQTTQYLDVYRKKSNGSYEKVENLYANYYNFLRLMVGNSDDVMSNYLDCSDSDYNPMYYDWNASNGNAFKTLAGIINGSYPDIYSLEKMYYSWDITCEDWSIKRFPQGSSEYSLWESIDAAKGITERGSGSWSAGGDFGYESQRARYISELSTAESELGGSLDSVLDPSIFVRTLYYYLNMSESNTLTLPYYDVGMESQVQGYGVDLLPMHYNGGSAIGFSIDFYHRYRTLEDRTVVQETYWSVSQSNSKVVELNEVNARTPDVGCGETVKIASIFLEVDLDEWERCESLVEFLYGTDKIYFGYEKNGSPQMVFDCYPSKALSAGKNYTPSQVEFMKCLETVNMNEGYGLNMLDFNAADVGEDAEWDADSLRAVCDKLANTSALGTDKEMVLKATMWGQRMAVDCFGNIICMGSNHQYIVVPACMNPYVWQAVDENGDDIGDSGAFMNIINAKNIVQIDKGILSGVNPSGSYVDIPGQTFNSSTRNHLTATLNNYLHTTTGYNGIGRILTDGSLLTDGGNVAARFVRGKSYYTVVDNSWWPWSSVDIAKSAVSNMVNIFQELHPGDRSALSTSVSSDAIWYWTDEYVPFIKNVHRIATSSGGGWLGSGNRVNILDGYVFIDNLGVYRNVDGSNHEYSAFNIEHYLDPVTGESAGSIAGDITATSDFGNNAEMLLSGKLNTLGSASEQALASIYISYAYAYFYTEDGKENTIGRLGYRFAGERLPDSPTNLVDIDLSAVMADIQIQSIRDWTYYLMHPTKGFEYVRILLTNKLNHLLLGWHNDMVGTNGVGVTAGTTKYRSNVGYVTMPDLSEIGWTDKLLAFYQDCLPFLILVVMLFMLCAFITGSLSLQRSLFACVLFSLFLMIPPTLINGTVYLSNSVSQRVYGEKFTYWAMVQQESYATKIDEAANSAGSSGTSSYENYLRTLYGLNQQVYSNQGGESVLLKWQAPKKMASLVLTEADAQSLKGLDSVGSSILYGMLGRTYGGQSYVDDTDAVYMYRSYIDISNFSRYIYSGIATGKVSSTRDSMSVKSTMQGSFSDSLTSSMNSFVTDYADYRLQGYTNWGRLENENMPNYDYLLVPLSSQIIADAVKGSSRLENFQTTSDGIAINQDVFNFGLPMFTSGVDFNTVNFAATGGFQPGSDRYTNLDNYLMSYSANENAYVGLAAYSLYSENPFYYFSWKLYHDGLGYSSSLMDRNGYKNLLLGKRDGGYFYKNEGNGGLKDFMDMRSLFTYIIPYMRECNDLVRRWDDMYGIFIYEGVPTEEGHLQDVSSDPELLAKYWHNLNVSRLYCLYCPWVDIMYDCSYSQPTTITVLGRQVVVEDPLNPASYPEDRPMIFSEAEMKDYGLSTADLTPAERLILKCNEDFQERMYELLNYYNFSDITLNTAAAIQCTFSFNTIFSETGVMTENHNIYPQSYDLANFSYDAFLRFILSESTGESMLNYSRSYSSSAGETSGDFYERIVNNSSTTTVIVMLILDILSVYVLPAFKMFFLVAIFLSSILVVFVSVCKIEGNSKFIRKASSGFVLPLLQFFAVTVVFSWVVSLFMGKGNNSVTQSESLSISMGDPVIALLAMIAIDLVALVLYWKIVNKLLKDIRFNSKMAFNFAGGVITAVGASAVGAVTSAVTGMSNYTKGVVDDAVDSSRHRRTRKLIKNLGEENAQQGTGRSSSRAERRGSKDVSGSQENSNRGSDSRRRTAKKYKSTGENSVEKRKKLNKTAKAGASKTKKSGGKRPVRLKR